MPRTGRPKVLLKLTSQEREQLVRWARRRKSSQALALRSRIVLACAEGLSNKEVAEGVGVSQPTVGKWRSRFVALRLDGLGDDPRPGRPPSITAEEVEDVVVATLESTPRNATHWSRSSMAARSGLSKSTIGRIWRAFELKPHRTEGFKVSNDPLFVDKVFDVIGLYLNPPDAAVVLCVDEKSHPVSALGQQDTVTRLRVAELEAQVTEYRHRAEVAEQLAAERSARVEDLRQALRMLEAGRPMPMPDPMPLPDPLPIPAPTPVPAPGGWWRRWWQRSNR